MEQQCRHLLNTAANWPPSTVPITTSDVAIPNKPKLANNVTNNNFITNLGSGLGFYALPINVF
jgi:hypothetical protein